MEPLLKMSSEQLHEDTESVPEDEILIYENNVKNVFCDKCNSRFFHISELVEHMRNIHDDQVHHCHHCDLVYRGSDEIFRQHVRNHESGIEMGDDYGDDTSNADETSFEDYTSVNDDNDMLESSTFRKNPSETQEERRVIERASVSRTEGVSYKCQICERLISSSRLEFLRHIRAHREYGHYRCNVCDEYFLVPFLLNEHKNESHPSIADSKNIKYHPEEMIKDSQNISNARSYMCEFCGKTYPSVTNLRAHQQIVHAHLKLYMCDFCERNYTTESALANHHRSHIREQGHYTCEYCDKKFRTSNSLHLHRRIHENQKPHVCTKCEKKFATKEDLREHIANHDKNPTFACETCGKSFVLKRNLLKHLHVHNNDETFVCKFCPSIKFRQKRYLRVHTQIHHPDALHDYIPSDNQGVDSTGFSSKKEEKTEPINRTRSECLEEVLKVVKSDGSKDNLGILRGRKRRKVKSAGRSGNPTEDVPEVAKTKRKKRLSDGPYVCDFCGKQFRLRDSFTCHLKIHMGEKQFTCHICGKQFIQAGCLYYHLRHFHGGVKNHTCDICGRSFAMKTTMEDHRRSRHTGERPYVCDICGKTFSSKSSLYIHRKIHTESYAHECNYCKKLFRWKQQLIGHLTMHTGVKKYSCDICGKAFGVKHHLTRHKRTHDKEKLYTCNKCGTSFGQKRYLASHERSKHK